MRRIKKKILMEFFFTPIGGNNLIEKRHCFAQK